MNDSMKVAGALGLFACFNLIAWVLIFLFVPETAEVRLGSPVLSISADEICADVSRRFGLHFWHEDTETRRLPKSAPQVQMHFEIKAERSSETVQGR